MGNVYVLPLMGESTLRAKVQSVATLWWGLFAVMVLFLGLIVPAVLWIPGGRRNETGA